MKRQGPRPRLVLICPNILGGAKLAEILAMRFSVRRTACPAECLWVLDHERPDAVVVDLSRLDTDVVCLLRTMLTRHPGCAVVGIGTAETGRAVLAAEVFLSAFLGAPVDANALLDRLSALVGDPDRRVPASRLSQATLRTIEYLGRHYADRIGLRAVGKAIGVSTSLLAHQFRLETGVTVMEFLRRIRIEAAKEILVNSEDKLEGVAAVVGFWDAAHLSRVFRRQTGRRPGAFRGRRHPVPSVRRPPPATGLAAAPRTDAVEVTHDPTGTTGAAAPDPVRGFGFRAHP